MTKTLLALSSAVLLAVPSLHAQSARSSAAGSGHSYSGGAHPQAVSSSARSVGSGGGRGYDYRGHGYYGGRGYGHYGRNYYLGGIGYYYPFYGYGYGLGFGYPYYAYNGGWNGYYGAGGGYGEDAAYEGRVADGREGNGQQQGPSLPSAVQRQLSKRGYYKGTVDGDFGPASRSALSHFQRDNHLKDTGRIDEDTLEALGFSDRR